MRLVVLSRSRFLHTTRWIVAAAKLRGHDVRVASPEDCTLMLDQGQPRLLHRGKLPYSADAVVSRFGASDWEHGLAVLRVLEHMGVPVLNPADALQQARDRLLCAAALAGFAVPVPSVALVQHPTSLPAVIETLGGLPCLLYSASRDTGGAAWLTTADAVTALRDGGWPTGTRFVVLKVEPAAKLTRALVVGSEIAGSVSMRPPWPAPAVVAGDKLDLPPQLSQLAQRVANGLGLGFCAVDMIETTAGPMVLDVEATPNLRGIRPAVRKTVVAAVIRRVEAMAVARIPV